MSKNRQNLSSSHDTRLTIAYLAPEAVAGPTPMSLWSGVETGAREQDLNLIAFPGGNIYSKGEQANIIYDLVTPETVAGLVTWAASLQYPGGQDTGLSEEELFALHARYHPLPIVTFSKAVPGHPAILIGSEQGMRDAIAHLIEVHGCRRIAFIRGPDGHPVADARYHAYLDTLADHGIQANADLVTPPGSFEMERGTQAVDLFLDQRNLRPKEDIEAIVAVSDLPALAAMEALQRRDIRVPEDVAVVGANDSAAARCANPPLTSLRVPQQELGTQAVSTLKRLLEGESVPDEMVIPSSLAIHQSCGCLDAIVAQAGAFSPRVGEGVSLEEAFVARREAIIQEMVEAMDVSEEPAWAESVLDAFTRDLGESQPGEFIATLQAILQRATLADRASTAWQNVLSVLQRYATFCGNPQKALLLIGQARAMLGETASRALAQQQLQYERHVQTLHALSSALITTFDVEKLMDVLAEGLPTLGIPSCYLALYEDPQPYFYPQPAPEWSRLMLAYDEGGRMALEPGGRRFSTRHLLPEGMLPAHRRYTMVLQPLYFQESQIGFALFEVGPQDWSVYDILRGEIASALHGALLVRRVQEHAMQLDEARRLAEAANRAKSVFLASMSHELRTPLNGILGYADILKRRVGYTGPLADGLDIIQRSGEHLLTLINDVLDLAKVEAGKLELAPAPFHLPTFLHQIVGIVRARAEAKDLTLTYEALSPLPETVVADETRLRQVLLNLLGNAVKFTDAGHVTLRVTGRQQTVDSRQEESATAPRLPSTLRGRGYRPRHPRRPDGAPLPAL